VNIVDTKLDKKDQLPVINEVSLLMYTMCEFQYNPYWDTLYQEFIIYIEESIVLSYTLVEGRIVNF